MITVRPAVPADSQMVARWCSERGKPCMPEVIPPIGVIAEDEEGPCACVFACMTCNIGLVFLEFAATRPLLPLKTGIAAMKALIPAIEAACLACNYNVFACYARPGFRRLLSKLGWQDGDQTPKTAMLKIREIPAS